MSVNGFKLKSQVIGTENVDTIPIITEKSNFTQCLKEMCQMYPSTFCINVKIQQNKLTPSLKNESEHSSPKDRVLDL